MTRQEEYLYLLVKGCGRSLNAKALIKSAFLKAAERQPCQTGGASTLANLGKVSLRCIGSGAKILLDYR